jgi:hypothetical protein
VSDISGEIIGVGQVCMVLSQHSSSSRICIASVFPDIPANSSNSVRNTGHMDVSKPYRRNEAHGLIKHTSSPGTIRGRTPRQRCGRHTDPSPGHSSQASCREIDKAKIFHLCPWAAAGAKFLQLVTHSLFQTDTRNCTCIGELGPCV